MTRQTISTAVSSALCFGVCAGFSFSQAWRAPPFALNSFLADLAVPGLATLTFILLAATIPSLMTEQPLRFPHTVTLPAVFVALLGVWASLLGTMRNSIAALPEPLAAAATWGHPERWVPAVLGQVAAMTLWVLVAKGRAHR